MYIFIYLFSRQLVMAKLIDLIMAIFLVSKLDNIARMEEIN